jgi:sugar-specific transcriptional regulator TrmB
MRFLSIPEHTFRHLIHHIYTSYGHFHRIWYNVCGYKSTNMEKSKLKDFLLKSGFLPKEVEVYLALLASGTSSVTHLASKAGINRTTAYDLLEKLKDKGLVGESDNKKIRQFTALEPLALKDYVAEQTQLWNQRLEDTANILQGLTKLRKVSSPNLPVLTVLEGKQGVKEILQDQLRKDIMQIDVISDNGTEIEDILGGFMKSFAKLKTHKKIKTRLIIPKQDLAFESKYYSPRAIEELFEVRYLDPKFSPDAEISIYENTVSVFSLREEEPIGVILESQVLANAHRALFEELWQKAEPRIKI